MKRIAVLNGPNLDRLGRREPHIYGLQTLRDLEDRLRALSVGVAEVTFLQSNHEGELIDAINRIAEGGTDGIIINPGGLSHTSVALRDAIAGCGIMTIEVHISNVHAREPFRQHLVTAGACTGIIAGLGLDGYEMALRKLLLS